MGVFKMRSHVPRQSSKVVRFSSMRIAPGMGTLADSTIWDSTCREKRRAWSERELLHKAQRARAGC